MEFIQFVLEWITLEVIGTIEAFGYFGIMALMALESANIPIPSEIIMPFSGFLASAGRFNFWIVVLWGAIGNLLGSLVSYYVGVYGGRSFVQKYGKYLFIHKKDLELADRLFDKYGDIIAFFSRIFPVVRTFVSLPAGIAGMNIWRFSVYTFAGSFLWSAVLTFAGFKAGENWSFLEPYFRKFNWVIVLVIFLGGIWWIRRYIREIRLENNMNNNEK